MSYAIFTVFYGIPLEAPISGAFPDTVGEAQDMELPGFHRHYSGSATVTPACFGVRLDGFDECDHHINVDGLTLAPTPEQVTEFQTLFDALDLEVQEGLKMFGVPRVFFLTSTS